MEIAALLVFGLALSLDGFGAGLAYGIRGIRVPLSSLVITSLASGAAIALSLALGREIAGLVSESFARTTGGLLLILLGMAILTQALRTATKRILRIRLPQLGLVIQVLLEPQDADLDRSGCISSREAALLGLSLALDAFGAGFALALSGMTTTFVPLIVITGLFLMLNAGILTGGKVSVTSTQRLNLVPGCILIALGMFRLMHTAL